MIGINPQNCFDCKDGLMVKPDVIHSYDFIEDGYVPNHCDRCGICSDSYEGFIKLKNLDRKRCSNRNIKMGLKILCNHQKLFSYDVRNSIYSFLKSNNPNTFDEVKCLIQMKLDEHDIHVDEKILIESFNN